MSSTKPQSDERMQKTHSVNYLPFLIPFIVYMPGLRWEVSPSVLYSFLIDTRSHVVVKLFGEKIWKSKQTDQTNMIGLRAA